MTENTFSAVASALGYAYQFRYALVLALRRLPEEMGWAVALEAADDIEVSSAAEVELVQLKHRAPATVLTDSSPDLWKTLRVWSEGISAGRLDPLNARLLLVTTASVRPGSVAACLTDSGDRDVATALDLLRNVVVTSSNVASSTAYGAFKGLKADQQEQLLNAIIVLATQANITELDDELGSMCLFAVRREHLRPFIERLEGWWFRRCLQQLAQPGGAAILAEEIEGVFADLRDQFRSTNLPIDVDLEFAEAQSEDFADRVFVHQLKIARIGGSRIDFAIRDYLRAFTQRSRWSRDGLLLVGELERYERRLVEEWSRSFERIRDELGDAAADEEQERAAQQLYSWVESADISIRSECNEPFVVRGSYQMLSDEQRVGWHPDFAARLVALLEPSADAP
jgi:hypothetical protein